MNYNERDIEHPALINFVKEHADIKSVLDVGAHYSYNTYAPELRKLVKQYDGVDILPDPITAKIVDNYFVKNVKKLKGEYDLVSCVSTIEHSGISTYTNANYKDEQKYVFLKLLNLSKKYVFLTFPYGLESFHEGEFANLTESQLDRFCEYTEGMEVKTTFYYSPAPQQKEPFFEIDQELAATIPYVKELGTRCICVMEITKAGGVL